jgi:RNA polymerase sigma-70 factor (ECF subfamily)
VGRKQDAEDLTAEVFLKVMEELGAGRFEWRHNNSFAAWVFRIAHNLVGNFRRDAARAGSIGGTEGAGHPIPLDELPEIASSDLPPEDALLRKEVFAQLHALVNELSARKREVVSLRYFAGLRNHEIAQVLGIDERTVAATLSRALDELGARLKLAGANEKGI